MASAPEQAQENQRQRSLRAYRTSGRSRGLRRKFQIRMSHPIISDDLPRLDALTVEWIAAFEGSSVAHLETWSRPSCAMIEDWTRQSGFAMSLWKTYEECGKSSRNKRASRNSCVKN